MYPHIHIFSFYVPIYGLSMSVGLISALYLIYRSTSSSEGFSQFIWFLFLFEMVGYGLARVSSILFFQSDVGTSIIGYQLAFVPVLLFYTRITKVNLAVFVVLVIPALVIIQIFGKVGCFFAGCCGGIHSSALIFPLQLLVSLALVGLFFVVRRNFFQSARSVLLTYFIGYFSIRYIEEFIRADSIQVSSMLTIGQCLVIVSTGLNIALSYVYSNDFANLTNHIFFNEN